MDDLKAIFQAGLLRVDPYRMLTEHVSIQHNQLVIDFENEKQQVDQMLILELQRHGGETDDASYKQAAKDLPGRGRS